MAKNKQRVTPPDPDTIQDQLPPGQAPPPTVAMLEPPPSPADTSRLDRVIDDPDDTEPAPSVPEAPPNPGPAGLSDLLDDLADDDVARKEAAWGTLREMLLANQISDADANRLRDAMNTLDLSDGTIRHLADIIKRRRQAALRSAEHEKLEAERREAANKLSEMRERHKATLRALQEEEKRLRREFSRTSQALEAATSAGKEVQQLTDRYPYLFRDEPPPFTPNGLRHWERKLQELVERYDRQGRRIDNNNDLLRLQSERDDVKRIIAHAQGF